MYPETAERISSILNSLHTKGTINKHTLAYLLPPPEPRPRKFYLLPKIHKEPAKWPNPDRMPPGRPIISDCGSESKAVSEYIDHFLAPLSVIHPAYLKDTPHFLDTISQIRIPKDSLLISMDVDGLYTNINNQMGLQAVQEIFSLHPDPTRPNQEILDLLRISLENNDFTFNGKWYLQTYGTAMGKTFAPRYADIFMAKWEREALAKTPHKPLIYKRYLDDIFMVWTLGKTAFEEFFHTLNTHTESIKLKFEISEQELNFLDVTTFKGPRFQTDNILDSKVYFKPTDTLQLLDKRSYHPKHTFSGIIKSQILRYKRICNNQPDIHRATQKLFQALRTRHYSIRFLRQIKQTVLNPKEDKPLTGASLQCGGPKCHICRYITPNNKAKLGEQDISLATTQNCNSSNGIYLITCTQCQIGYVGETGNSYRTRLLQHLSDIRLNKDTPVGRHFSSTCSLTQVAITLLETIPEQEEKYKNKANRLSRERHWTKTLGTFRSPHLNTIRLPLHDPIIPFVIPHSEMANQASILAKDTFDQVKASYPDAFPHRCIRAFSRNKNLKDILVSALLPTQKGNVPLDENTTPHRTGDTQTP